MSVRKRDHVDCTLQNGATRTPLRYTQAVAPTFQKRERNETPISVEEAQRRVLALAQLSATESVALESAGGRVLREQITSDRDVPAADNSAMDGYAVIAADLDGAAADTPVTLRVIEDVRAGSIGALRVSRGFATRIMTGAPLPEGADAVVPVELTDAGNESVRINGIVGVGANIRRRGEDLRAESLVIASGTLLRAAEIGVLATLQTKSVVVAKKARVAIIATGDELVGLREDLRDGAVVNSNSYSLAELVRESGAEPWIAPIVRDDLPSTRQAIEQSLEYDVTITTGGVSAGAFDFVKDALDALGATTHVSKVAMKPGKPVVVSTIGERLVFGLPGNPVSCMVTFTLFVAPALRKMSGRHDLFPPVVRTRLLAPLPMKGDRRAYQRVHVTASKGQLESEPMQRQGSGVSSSMLRANGYAITEPGASLATGDLVDTLLIGEVALATL